MFFNLTHQIEDNFSFNYVLPCGLILNTDDGWETYNFKNHMVVIKGVVDHFSLQAIAEDLINQFTPSYRGNFCAFISSDNDVRLLHDIHRSFPLWIGDKSVTNLDNQGEQIWSDTLITVSKNLEYITKIDISDPHYRKPYEITPHKISDETIIDTIHNVMMDRFENFLSHNTKPIKMFLSGGVDTTTCWAYLDHFTKDYEFVDYEYVKFTPFWKKNNYKIKNNFWAYNQIHLWDEDCVLISGSGGCYLLRNQTTATLALKAAGIQMEDVIKPGDYYYEYYTNNKRPVPDEVSGMSREELHDHILARCTNDYQHWHIDKTLTFTPLRDSLLLLPLILQGSDELLIKQVTNGFINRELIRKLDPSKLNKISPSKNYNAKASV